MRRIIVKKFLLFFLVLFNCNLFGQQLNVVTTAVPFLRVSPDARSGGMGDIGIAISPDANAVFMNNARLAFIEKKSQVVANLAPWLRDAGFKDVNLFCAGGYKKLKNNQTISVGVKYFTLGNIQLTDFNGNLLNNIKPNEYSIEAGYSRLLSPKLSVGINLKYIRSQLALGDAGFGNNFRAGNSVAADLGLYYNGLDAKQEGWQAGFVFQNLGPKINYSNDPQNKSYLPATMGLGINYTKQLAEKQHISVGFEVNKLMVPDPPQITGNVLSDSNNLATYKKYSVFDSWFSSFATDLSPFKSLQTSVGVEYNFNKQFWLRTGYFYESKERGGRQYFSTGTGFQYKSVTANLSYIVPSGNGLNRNPLSNTLRLGLIFAIQ